MRQVEVSYVVEPSRTDLLAHLSPERIIEYADIYELESATTENGTEQLVVVFDDERLVLEFVELENGYKYTLVEASGIFAERQSTLTIEESEQTEVIGETIFTLDTFWSILLDRFAGKTVQQELENTIENLVSATIDSESDPK